MRFRRSIVRALSITACMATVAAVLSATPANASTPPAPPPPPTVLGYGPVLSDLANTNKCLDDYLAATTDGSKVDLYDCNDSAAQQWQVMSDGTIQIFGKCLDVSGGGTANGTLVQIYSCNNTGAQQWAYKPANGNAGSQYGELVNPQSGRCLDDPALSTTNGTQLQIYDCNGGTNQYWSVPGESAGPAITWPGGDMVMSVDDGGVPQATMQQVISTYWPQSVGAPVMTNSATWLNTVLKDQYNATGAKVTSSPPQLPPPDLTGGTVTVSGNTLTVDIPAATVAQDEGTPGWIAAAWGAAAGIVAALFVFGVCAIFFASPLSPLGAAICTAASTFMGTIAYYVVYYKIAGIPLDWNAWGIILSAALVYAGVGFAVGPMIAWMTRVLPGTAAAVAQRVATAIRALKNWFGGNRAGQVGDEVGNELGTIGDSVGQASINYAEENGLPVPAGPTGPVTSGIAGKCMDDSGGQMNNHDAVVLYHCTGGANQNWTLWSNGMLEMGARCLSVVGEGTAIKSKLELYQCDNSGAQQWRQVGEALLNPQSGLCVDDPGLSTVDTTQLQIYTCNGGTNQQWVLPAGTVNGGGGGVFVQGPPTGGSLGSNVYVFNPGMAQSVIQADLNQIAASTQAPADQFTNQRYEVLFEPGTYGSASNPLVFSAGYYEAIAGLGQSPAAVTINGGIQSWDQCGVTLPGAPTGCYGTTNFWRSITNLTINVNANSGCQAGTDFWATSQEAPLRRVIVNGNFSLMDYCDAGPSWTSGGFIADSQFNGGKITNGSEQQFMTRNTSIDSWSNSVWNQVFCGDPGAPAQQFIQGSGAPGGPSAYTTLGTCPATRETPYLYDAGGGNYQVFVPSAQYNSSGPTWTGGGTPGKSLPLSSFFVVNPGNVSDVNAALAAGDNLLFTPGFYDVTQTMNVTKPDTVILGLGFATLYSDGAALIATADVPGVIVSGLILDAGPSGASPLLQLGTPGSTANNSADPDLVSDVTLRVGGAEAGTTGTAFIDDANNSIIDDVWAWRADHGSGAGSWTSDTAKTGLIVNGNNVTANGLFVEHFQQDEVDWNGNGGKVVMFQNENPYEVPNQAAWMRTATQDGYPAFDVNGNVTSFTGYGMGSYCYFDQGVNIQNAMAFEAPQTPGVSFHDLLTVWLNGYGSINSVIDGLGSASTSSTKSIPQNVPTFP